MEATSRGLAESARCPSPAFTANDFVPWERANWLQDYVAQRFNDKPSAGVKLYFVRALARQDKYVYLERIMFEQLVARGPSETVPALPKH